MASLWERLSYKKNKSFADRLKKEDEKKEDEKKKDEKKKESNMDKMVREANEARESMADGGIAEKKTKKKSFKKLMKLLKK